MSETGLMQGDAGVAVEFEHAPQDHLGGGSGELAEGLIDLGEQRGVAFRVAALEGLGRRLAPAVADLVGAVVLADEAVA